MVRKWEVTYGKCVSCSEEICPEVTVLRIANENNHTGKMIYICKDSNGTVEIIKLSSNRSLIQMSWQHK